MIRRLSLALKREALAPLDDDELAAVAGGTDLDPLPTYQADCPATMICPTYNTPTCRTCGDD